MPRPKKAGLDYFYTDVHEMDQREIIHLLNRYGPSGYCIYQVIRCMIYENGYYLEESMDSIAILVTRTLGNRWIRDTSFVEKVIHYCAELGLFDDDLLRKGVFTSKAIQKDYQAVTARSKADKSKYWLPDDPDETTESDPEADFNESRVTGSQKKGRSAAGRPLSAKAESSEKTRVYAEKTSEKPSDMHQRKENKTKPNESKAEESKPSYPAVPPEAAAAQRREASSEYADTEGEYADAGDIYADTPYEEKEDYASYASPDDPESEYTAATGRKFNRNDRAVLSEMHSLGATDGLITEIIREVGERDGKEICSLRYYLPIVKEALRGEGRSKSGSGRRRSGMCEETSTSEDIEAVLNAEWEMQMKAYEGTAPYLYDDA